MLQTSIPVMPEAHDSQQSHHEKLESLRAYLRELGSVAVLLSTDDAALFLAKVAHDTLGNDMVALNTAQPSTPEATIARLETFCALQGMPYEMLQLVDFEATPVKEGVGQQEIAKIKAFAGEKNMSYVVAPFCVESLDHDRETVRALFDVGIKVPLIHAGLTCGEVAQLAREMAL